MIDLNYTNVISTIGALGTFVLIGWNIYTWKQTKKQEEKPVLKVVIKNEKVNYNNKLPVAFIRNIPHRTFYIQNNGKFNIQILSCFIDSIPIESCSIIEAPNNIIKAKVGPGNFVSSPIVECYELSGNLPGKIARIKCKVDTGNIFEEDYTLSEEKV